MASKHGAGHAPVTCWKKGIMMAMISSGRYCGRKILRQGCLTCRAYCTGGAHTLSQNIAMGGSSQQTRTSDNYDRRLGSWIQPSNALGCQAHPRQQCCGHWVTMLCQLCSVDAIQSSPPLEQTTGVQLLLRSQRRDYRSRRQHTWPASLMSENSSSTSWVPRTCACHIS